MNDEPYSNGASSDRHRHVLFAGGGSAGHVFPGLAVAEVLAARGWVVSWAGRPAGMERELVEGVGLHYAALPAAPLVGQGVRGKLGSLLTLVLAAWRGRRLIRQLGADVVVGTGGYVSAPAVLGAKLGGRPSLLLEPNARAGAANRLLSRWASAAAVAFVEAEEDFACRVETTGTPVRAGFFDRSEGRLEAAPTVLIVGGSQGARQINELLPPAIERLGARLPRLRVRHQTGAGNVDSVRVDYTQRKLDDVELEVVAFLEDMPAVLGAADLVVSRAGAVTLAEICAAGRPSVLMPLRQAGDHQLDNARRLAVAGAAIVLEDGDASVDGIFEALAGLLGDRERLTAMSDAASALAVDDAAERIADLIHELAEAA
ncbi:MAG: undecaprenyldiphospho-muramoylpentapeptide beta-N-acetylglucosaminyltransferase [Acidobacteria bacterium]|nr:undecaprenyldiphospho-muramoylpentapeptide beta-N-acetylglucosaminyltransferase [Acidobacteriota bacterium]